MSIKDTVVSAVGGVVSIFTGLSQAENQRSKAPKVITPGMPELLRSVAAQGAVLLKNDGVLPFKKDSEVALFGRVQKDWFFTGYGSGGDVNKPYAVDLVEGIRNCDSLKLNEELAKDPTMTIDRFEEFLKNNSSLPLNDSTKILFGDEKMTKYDAIRKFKALMETKTLEMQAEKNNQMQ